MNSKMVFLLAVLSLGVASAAECQRLPETDPGRSVRLRSDLERLLETYEEVLESPAYSQDLKGVARERASAIRVRLEEGDFRLGDRIVLYVEGEPSLPDTVPVESGPMIALPLFGDISLAGVLRSEIESHLATELARFIRQPVVRAQGLMRMSIQGAVAAPGFYTVPADMLLEDVLMRAGGPGPGARLDRLYVERGPRILMEGAELQEALRQGLTIDQLNFQAGDQITVPQQGSGILPTLGLIAGLIGSVGFLLIR